MGNAYQNTFLSWKSVFPMMLLWFGVAWTISALDRSQRFPAWVVTAILMVMWGVGLMNLSHTILRSAWSIRTFGSELPRRILRMARIFPNYARAPHELAKLSGFVFLILLVLAPGVYDFGRIAPPFVFFYFSVCSVIVARAFIPPSAILLTSSASNRLKLLAMLQNRAIPGVTALLDVSRHLDVENPSFKVLRKANVCLNDARTGIDDAWKEAAGAFLEIVPTILFDARETTQGVLYEAERVFREGHYDKCVFIVTDTLDGPALEHGLQVTGVERPEGLVMWTEGALIARITRLVWSQGLRKLRLCVPKN